MSGLKDALYDQIQRDSQNVKHLAEDWNWGFLEEEAKKNEKNPGRAAGKAATAAATWYLGGPLWNSLGSGANAAGQAANAAIPAMAEMGGQTAAEVAKQMAQQGMLQGAQQGAMQGLMSGAYDAMVPGIGSQQAQMLAAQTGDMGAYGLGKTMESAGYAKDLPWQESIKGQGAGLLSGLGRPGPMGDMGRRMMMNQGMGMLQPEQPMQAPPPPRYEPPPPQPPPYLSEDEKRRWMMMQGYQVY